ncbi:MAG: carbon storage regulator CsrA [Gammaproteobacteria bacterium]|nr:carbon storage regulator CsrA [Gammaproteobacteria bacterium]
MLILTRKIGESLIIDDEVTVTVMGMKGNQVRLGIDAPRNVRIYREEIFPRDASSKARESEKE